ncbi:MAG: SOS response-associated peptidase [Planctomycetota bacterium]|nr:SOS response-associated peptidase [Planctomycetota bacterium]
MCGRYANSADISVVADELAAADETAGAWRPSWNAAPSTQQLVAVTGAAGVGLRIAAWGWRRDFARRPLFNATVEKAPRSPLWRVALQQHRCVVPVTGWWEWAPHQDQAKWPFFHSAESGAQLYLAGLMDPANQGGAFTVLTRPALPQLAAIHHRMPLVMGPAAAREWLCAAGESGLMDAALAQPMPSLVVRPGPRRFGAREDGSELVPDAET